MINYIEPSPLQKRALFSAFDELNDMARVLVEYLAFHLSGVSRSMLRQDGVKLWTMFGIGNGNGVKTIDQVRSELKEAGLLEEGSSGVRCTPALVEEARFCAWEEERSGTLLEMAEDNDAFESWRSYYQADKDRVIFGEALYRGDNEQCFKTYQKIIDEDDYSGFTDRPLAQMLANSTRFVFLETGPVHFLLAFLPDAIARCQLHHRQAGDWRAPMRRFLERAAPVADIFSEEYGELCALVVAEYWLCGQMDQAKWVLESPAVSTHFNQASQAMAALATGDLAVALSTFEAALAAYRKVRRKKRLFFNNWVGVLFIYACLFDGSPEWMQRAAKLLDDGESRTNNGQYQELFERLALITSAQFSARDSSTMWALVKPWIRHRQPTIEGAMEIFSHGFLSPRKVAQFPEATVYLEGYLGLLEGTCHRQFTADLQALVRAIDKQKNPPETGPGNENRPSSHFHFTNRQRGRWRMVLHSMSSIAESSPPADAATSNGQAERRLVWRISTWNMSRKGWSALPFLQKRGKNGRWSKGKLFTLESRHDPCQDTSFLLPEDGRALHALESVYAKERREPAYEMCSRHHLKVVHALVGHPHVFMEGRLLLPVEIVEGTPRIEVTRQAGGVKVKLVPAADESVPVVIEQTTPDTLTAYKLTGPQCKLLDALGSDGMVFPRESMDKLSSTLSNVTHIAQVHSHVPNVGTTSKAVPPARGITVRMQLFADVISAQLLVYPLGVGGPWFVPGQGPTDVFATIKGENRVTRRALDTERKMAVELWEKLGLDSSCSDKDGLYRFDNEQEALTFLSELTNCMEQSTDGHPSVEWPKGISLRCSRTMFPKDLALHVGKKRKWLAVNGELKVSQTQVYSLAEVVAGLPTLKQNFMVLRGSQFLRLSESLKRYLQNIKAMALQKQGAKRENGDPLELPEAAMMNLQELSEEAGQLTVDEAWQQTLARIKDSEKLTLKIPKGLHATLRDYQREGLSWLQRLSHLGLGACLADDMGLGKTIQALGVMLLRLKRRGKKAVQKPALVVAPVSVIQGWLQEAKRFAPSLKMIAYEGTGRAAILHTLKPGQVLITSYGLLQRDAQKLASIDFDMVILDEAQFIKNKDSARAKAAVRLKADFRLAMTGTPVENRLLEFWSIFNFLNPGLLGEAQSFRQRYEKGVALFDDTGMLASLRWQVMPFLLRRTKEEILTELPRRTEIVRYCEMTGRELAFYELRRRQAEDSLLMADSSEQMMALITGLTALRQAACHPRLLEPQLQLGSAKLNCLGELLTECRDGGHRALIFSQFVRFLSLVREWLDAEGFTYQYMDGSTPRAQRERAIEAFQDGAGDAFVISTKSGGFGLNLTGADYVIHLDPWWNPAVEDQASDRVYRIGQTKPVTVYKIVTRGTVEEKVIQLHQEKRQLADGLLTGSNAAATMEMSDLLELLRNDPQ